MKHKAKLLIAAYAVIGVLTFGRAAADWGQTCSDRRFCGVYFATMGGLAAGAAWPLYWSWELQE